MNASQVVPPASAVGLCWTATRDGLQHTAVRADRGVVQFLHTGTTGQDLRYGVHSMHWLLRGQHRWRATRTDRAVTHVDCNCTISSGQSCIGRMPATQGVNICHPFPSPPPSLLAVQGHSVREEQQAVIGLLGMWGGSQRPHLSSEGCVVCHRIRPGWPSLGSTAVCLLRGVSEVSTLTPINTWTTPRPPLLYTLTDGEGN